MNGLIRQNGLLEGCDGDDSIIWASVLILTLNEEVNIEACLQSVSSFYAVFVLDSGSTDRTRELAESYGAKLLTRRFDNWSAHQNWALENIAFPTRWLLYLDADERVTDDLREEIRQICNEQRHVSEVAFYCGRRNFFLGTWLKHAMPPVPVLRLFQPDRVRFERLVNPVPRIDGPWGQLRSLLDHHNFSKGIGAWVEKHAAYATLEAKEALSNRSSWRRYVTQLFSRDAIRRREALKALSFRLPFRPTLRFIYMYLLKLGVLDGRNGLTYCRLVAFYEYLIVLNEREIKHQMTLAPNLSVPHSVP